MIWEHISEPMANVMDKLADRVISGHRDGRTYDDRRDRLRLNRQARMIYDVMIDGRWRSLADINHLTAEPEASISARLRDLRKPRFGSHLVERRYIAHGVWEYRVLPPEPELQADLWEGA